MKKPAHDMHKTIHKLVHEAVLKVDKPRDALAKSISHEIEKNVHHLTKGQCKKLEEDMDTVIDEARDAKFMKKEPTKDKGFMEARKKVEKDANTVDKEPAAKEETKTKATADAKKKKEPVQKKEAEKKKKAAPAKDSHKKESGHKKQAAFKDKLENMGSLKEDHLHLHDKKDGSQGTHNDKKMHGGHAGGGKGGHAGDHGMGSKGGGHVSHDHGKGK